MQFLLLLDDVGAEFTYARVNRKQMIAPVRNRVLRERPLAIKPLELIQPNDKAGRAAGGFLLLGPIGAAMGVLTSKGPAVRFELQFADTVRQGLIPQRQYGRLRHKIEKMQVYRSGDLGRRIMGWATFAMLTLVFCAAMGPFGLLASIGTTLVYQWIRSRRARRVAE